MDFLHSFPQRVLNTCDEKPILSPLNFCHKVIDSYDTQFATYTTHWWLNFTPLPCSLIESVLQMAYLVDHMDCFIHSLSYWCCGCTTPAVPLSLASAAKIPSFSEVLYPFHSDSYITHSDRHSSVLVYCWCHWTSTTNNISI
jgi:hypothetical protein